LSTTVNLATTTRQTASRSASFIYETKSISLNLVEDYEPGDAFYTVWKEVKEHGCPVHHYAGKIRVATDSRNRVSIDQLRDKITAIIERSYDFDRYF
jgi:hypothetical protein